MPSFQGGGEDVPWQSIVKCLVPMACVHIREDVWNLGDWIRGVSYTVHTVYPEILAIINFGDLHKIRL